MQGIPPPSEVTDQTRVPEVKTEPALLLFRGLFLILAVSVLLYAYRPPECGR